MNENNIFSTWKINGYRAENENHCLWICNGFIFFRDCDSFGNNPKPFLMHLSWFQRYRLWRELKREMRRRSFESIKDCHYKAGLKEQLKIKEK